jgi:hypothetical protein
MKFLINHDTISEGCPSFHGHKWSPFSTPLSVLKLVWHSTAQLADNDLFSQLPQILTELLVASLA